MGFKILFVLTLSVYLVNAAATRDENQAPISKGDGQPVDWYDCRGKMEGNYQHPHDCKQYISCTRAELAYEMDCAACHWDAVTCPENRLHFNEAQNKCLYVNEAGCSGGGEPTNPPPVDTTKAPSVETTPDGGSGGPTEGGPVGCDPDECKTTGWCHDYKWCHRLPYDHKQKDKAGEIREGRCPPEHNMYFNPNITVHGGACSFWGNLEQVMKDAYNNDEDCIDPHCEWRPFEEGVECASKYWYFHPDEHDGEAVEQECSSYEGSQLIWDQDTVGCRHCSEVFREDGSDCCPPAHLLTKRS